MLVDIEVEAPKRVKKFWLSDYIYENRQSDGKKPLTSKYGMARRMPRINKRHEKLFEDTLKVIAKEGETSQITVEFQEKFKARSIKCATMSISPRKFKSISALPALKTQDSLNKFKRQSGELLRRIDIEDDCSQEKNPQQKGSGQKRQKQKMAFKIKASNEWMKTQKQILKVSIKQEGKKLERRRLGRIQMGADNRTVEQLLSELKR